MQQAWWPISITSATFAARMVNAGQVLQAYSWHDDRTRIRIFAQETEAGIRLFTEWREWPIPAKTVAAK